MPRSNNPVANLTEYELRHLVAHIADAGRDEELHRLLALETEQGRNAWYDAKETTGDVGYLDDITLAWRIAEAKQNIPKQIKYGLCWSSIVAMAANYPPELLASAVQHKLLTPKQALNIIEQIPNEKHSTEALLDLIPHLPIQLFANVQTIIESVEEAEERAMSLAGLAPHLPENEQRGILQKILRVVRSIDNEKKCAKVLGNMVPYLSNTLLATEAHHEILTMARSFKNDTERARVLIDLAPYLSISEQKPVVHEALVTAEQLTEEQFVGNEIRAEVLTNLLPLLAGSSKQETARKVLEAARSIRFVGDRVSALYKLAPYLPEDLLEKALQIALAAAQEEEARIKAEWEHTPGPFAPASLPYVTKDEVLAKFTPYLQRKSSGSEYSPEEIRMKKRTSSRWRMGISIPGSSSKNFSAEDIRKFLMQARMIKDEVAQVKLLTRLIPHLPKVVRQEAIQSTLEVARSINYENKQAEALTELGPYLTKTFLTDVIDIVRRFRDEGKRSKMLIVLASQLSEPLLAEAIGIARGFRDTLYQAEILIALAPYLSKELLSEALAIARKMELESVRVEALIGLTPYLSKDLVTEIWDEIREFSDETILDEAIIDLAPHLPEALLPEALEMVRKIEIGSAHDEWRRFELLIGLAPYLSKDLVTEVWDEIREFSDETILDEAIIDLAPHLPEALLPEVLEMVQKMELESVRVEALIGLAPYLSKDLVTEIWDEIRESSDETISSEAIIDLVPNLPEALLTKILVRILAIDIDMQQTERLIKIAQDLSANMRTRILNFVQSIEDEHHRAVTLRDLFPHLSEAQQQEILQEVVPYSLERAINYIGVNEADFGLHTGAESGAKSASEYLAGLTTPYLYIWSQNQPDLAHAIWEKMLRELTAYPRAPYLCYLRVFLPFGLALTENEEETAVKIFNTIQAVTRWWP